MGSDPQLLARCFQPLSPIGQAAARSGLVSLDLIEVLEGAHARVATRTAFAGRVERYYETPAPHVTGDSAPLGPALGKLVGSACRSMLGPQESAGLQLGVVTVPAEGSRGERWRTGAREVWVTVAASRRWQRPESFDRFATARARGELADAEEIAAAHGSSLEATTGGAAFRVRLLEGRAR